MRLSTTIQIGALLVLHLGGVNTFPVDENIITLAQATDQSVYVRALGTEDDPIEAWIACSGMENVCEADCIAILCHGQPQKMERNSTMRPTNYVRSGASLRPFADTEDMMRRRGVSIPDPTFISAEETTYESVTQGGAGTIIFLVPESEQHLQGGLIRFMFRTYSIGQGQWFLQKFSNLSPLTPHCLALMSSPPDYSICTKKPPPDFKGIDLKPYAFIKSTERSNPSKFINQFAGYTTSRADGSELLENFNGTEWVTTVRKRKEIESGSETEGIENKL